jgi:hypothetical protein
MRIFFVVVLIFLCASACTREMVAPAESVDVGRSRMRVMTLDPSFNLGNALVTCYDLLANPPMTEQPQEDLWIRFIEADSLTYEIHVFRDRTSAIETPLDLSDQVMYQTGILKIRTLTHSQLLLDDPATSPDYTGCALAMRNVQLPSAWGGCVWSYAAPVVTPSHDKSESRPESKKAMQQRYRPYSVR